MPMAPPSWYNPPAGATSTPPPQPAPPELPPEIPVAPWTPPTETSGGGSGGGQGEGWFPVGYEGTPPRDPQGGSLTGGQPFPWGGLRESWGQSQQAMQSGLDMITGGLAENSPFAQLVMGRLQNPYGLDPAALQQQRRMAAQVEAGSRENALLRSRQRSHATGFGNSAAANAAEDQIRTQSAANLNDTYARLFIEDEMRKLQREGLYGGLAGQAYGQDAGLRSTYAGIQAQRQFPIFPGGQSPYGGEGGYGGAQPIQDPGAGWWNQSGRYQPGNIPYDPFVQGPGNAGPGGGWTPQNPRPSW